MTYISHYSILEATIANVHLTLDMFKKT